MNYIWIVTQWIS